MAPVGQRLGLMETALSGRDRAKLYVQAAARGEDPDERLDRYCPASERASFEAVKDAVARGVQEIWQRLLFDIEWVNNDDISMGWLECISGFVERERSLKKLAGPGAKSVAAMARPGRGFIRDLPLLWGVLVNAPESPPASWEDAVGFLVAELRRGVEVRWRGLLAYERSLAVAAAALGVDIGHPDMTKAMLALRTKVLDLHGALQPFERFELPEPGGREMEMVASFWAMDVLREPEPPGGGPSSMFVAKREELETWEREQASKLRESHGRLDATLE